MVQVSAWPPVGSLFVDSSFLLVVVWMHLATTTEKGRKADISNKRSFGASSHRHHRICRSFCEGTDRKKSSNGGHPHLVGPDGRLQSLQSAFGILNVLFFTSDQKRLDGQTFSNPVTDRPCSTSRIFQRYGFLFSVPFQVNVMSD